MEKQEEWVSTKQDGNAIPNPSPSGHYWIQVENGRRRIARFGYRKRNPDGALMFYSIEPDVQGYPYDTDIGGDSRIVAYKAIHYPEPFK